MLLDAAIVEFRYPRVSLEHDEYEFTAELTNDEIQVLSSLMRLGWIRRCISTWDNVRHLWSDKDYSPANFLQRLTELETVIEKDSRRLKDWYGRSHQYKPDPIFGRLAGK